MRTSRIIICALVPRFGLRVAMGGRWRADVPAALGPEPGGPRVIGETNAAAAAFGVRAGMPAGEAIARCPRIELVTADPGAVADAGEQMLSRLEALGAAVEPLAPGRALFAGDGLVRLHRGPMRLLEATAGCLPPGGRVGAGPGRFIAQVAAGRARPGRPLQVGGTGVAAFLEELEIERLPIDPGVADQLAALGIRTAGRLAAMPLPAVADRFGREGIRARQLAYGEDEAFVAPRTPPEPLRERVAFAEPAGDELTLRQALAVLIERLLAHPRREGRPLRALAVSAELDGGGSWRRTVALRDATAEPRRLRDALFPHLAELPGAVCRLTLEVTELARDGDRQEPLLKAPEALRRERAAEAARQVRAALGDGHLLRVVDVAPWSRIPEGRSLLVPYEG